MGLKRYIWRTTKLGRTVDTVKNIVEEGNIKDGLKRTLKEDICEDNPIGKAIYETGNFDGKKAGYEMASNEYETKLLKQADEFLAQKQIFEAEKEKYENLLDEYEEEIVRLEEKTERTETENQYLYQLLFRERELKKMIG